MRYSLQDAISKTPSTKAFFLNDTNYNVEVIVILDLENGNLEFNSGIANKFDLYETLVKYDKNIYKLVPSEFITPSLNEIVKVFSDIELKEHIYKNDKHLRRAYKKEECKTMLKLLTRKNKKEDNIIIIK